MIISQSENETPLLTMNIKATISEVWSGLRDKNKLFQWHGWDYPSIEGEVEEIYFTNTSEEGAADDKKRVLVVNGGDTFVLEAEENGNTKLMLIRAPQGDAKDAFSNTITEGWISFMEQLRFMLEQQPTDVRKTVLINKPLSRDNFLANLGISDTQESASFTGLFANEKITGTVWFNTTHQIGLAVDSWGPGLLSFNLVKTSVF